MIFVAAIIAVFVLTSIYFFFRAESLQREVLIAKREMNNTAKENKALVASMVTVSGCFEEFAKQRFNNVKAIQEARKNGTVVHQLETFSPLIHNYAVIYRESSKGSGQLKAIAKKCFDSQEKGAFNNFVSYINRQDKQVRNMWSSNDLKGFISLVEVLLSQQEEKLMNSAAAKDLKKAS